MAPFRIPFVTSPEPGRKRAAEGRPSRGLRGDGPGRRQAARPDVEALAPTVAEASALPSGRLRPKASRRVEERSILARASLAATRGGADGILTAGGRP
jgi:hypothetical protein